ncbi:MAG: hypothetical protein R3A13_00985 [Bdellovibrionota bacterium]
MKVFLVVLLIVFPVIAHARPYRCFGRVYQIPCNQVQQAIVQQPTAETPRARFNPETKKNNSNLKLTNQSFKKLTATTGHWRGYISGTGLAQLKIDFFSKAKKVSSKYLGKVQLSKAEGPIYYSYISSLPRISDLSWKVIAESK